MNRAIGLKSEAEVELRKQQMANGDKERIQLAADEKSSSGSFGAVRKDIEN